MTERDYMTVTIALGIDEGKTADTVREVALGVTDTYKVGWTMRETVGGWYHPSAGSMAETGAEIEVSYPVSREAIAAAESRVPSYGLPDWRAGGELAISALLTRLARALPNQRYFQVRNDRGKLLEVPTDDIRNSAIGADLLLTREGIYGIDRVEAGDRSIQPFPGRPLASARARRLSITATDSADNARSTAPDDYAAGLAAVVADHERQL